METNVTFTSGDSAVALAGTLAVPAAGRDAPAVVLVSGTGPVDRDVTVAGHELFRVTAHRLARAGVASLRFDKRGVGESEGEFDSAGVGEFVADVTGALEYLVDSAGFARERTGLLGHSEGGLVALTAASRVRTLPYCVTLAGPMLPGKDNLVRTLALLARGDHRRDAGYDRLVADLSVLIGIARSGGAPAEHPGALELANRLAPRVFGERTKIILGADKMSGEGFLSLLSSPCLDTSLGWDPAAVIRRVDCPVLAVYASKDVQAPGPENAAAARALLDALDKDLWEIREISGMNHAFQRCTTGMPDEYETIDHAMADEVVDEVSAWIHSRCLRA